MTFTDTLVPAPATQELIPRNLHYVFISTSTKPYKFDWLKYISLLSALHYIRPRTVIIHITDQPPSGDLWERAKVAVEKEHAVLLFEKWDHLTEIGGKGIIHVEHLSDYIRVRALHAQGGIYLDWDCVAVNDITPLLFNDTVLCAQSSPLRQICLGAFLTRPGTQFLSEWLRRYEVDFRPKAWEFNSQVVPYLLAVDFPLDKRPVILPPISFGLFWPVVPEAVPGEADDFAKTFLIHQYYTDQPDFWDHVLSEEVIMKGETPLARRLRPCLDKTYGAAKVLHIGTGAFALGFIPPILKPGVGMVAAAIRSGALVKELRENGGEFLLDDGQGPVEQYRVAGTVLPEEREELERLIARPEVQVVSLTVTSVGYDNTDLYDRLISGLSRRSQSVALLSLDNVAVNGAHLRDRLLKRVADRNMPGLEAWIRANLFTPNTVVDRITPGREGLRVRTEAHHRFVLQGAGDFPGAELFEGLKFVKDIQPHSTMKLFAINGTHTVVALYGLKYGKQYVHEVLGDPKGKELVQSCHDEYAAIMEATLSDRLREEFERATTRLSDPSTRDRVTRLTRSLREKVRDKVAVPTMMYMQLFKTVPVGLTRTLSIWWTLWSEGSSDEILPASLLEDDEFMGVLKQMLCQKLVRQVLDMTSTGNMKWVDFDVDDLKTLALASKEVFSSGPSLLEIKPGINICGDIHGQLQDLCRIFERLGYPPKARYLFLGDLVDRGSYNLEVLVLLFSYRILYPNHVHILRGNHESESLTRVYGFMDEVKRRYTLSLWKTIVSAFRHMPLAAVVGEKIFCCHGGISPDLKSLDNVRDIERPCDVEQPGLATDLLWADPDQTGTVKTFSDNEERGVSYVFGEEAVVAFHKNTGIDLLVRAHEVCEDGYQFNFSRKMITVFSAPNYCGEIENSGGVLHVSPTLNCSISVFEPVSKLKSLQQGSRKASPKTPLKRNSPKKGSPKRASPKRLSPKRSSPKRGSPRRASPKRAKRASPRAKSKSKVALRRKTPKV